MTHRESVTLAYLEGRTGKIDLLDDERGVFASIPWKDTDGTPYVYETNRHATPEGAINAVKRIMADARTLARKRARKN